MESILKALSVGFLLRSLFAGFFFYIAFSTIGDGRLFGSIKHKAFSISEWIPLALVSGIFTYCIHRSILYPLLEYWFDLDKSRELRLREPSISRNTIEAILARWDRAAPKEREESRAKHISIWADYTHLLYTSSLCIAFGTIIGHVVYLQTAFLEDCYFLLILALIFLLCAFVSDVRLHCLEDFLRETKKDAPTHP